MAERLLIEISETGARVVQGKVADIGKEARKSETGVQALKRALQFGIAALGLREAIKVTSDFGRELARVSIASGAVGDALDRLGAEARGAGAELGFGATESVRALGTLQRAGLASADSIGALREAMQLAAATGSDLTSATGAFANTAQAFRIKVSDAGRAVDILATAAARSNSSFEEMSTALARTAPAAQKAGLGLAEMSALVGVLNDAGLEGRMAISGLREALEALESPVASERAALQSLGLDLQAIRPSAVGLSEALDELGKRGVRLESLGIRGGAALDVLATRTPAVKELLSTIQKSDGAAGKFADTAQKNLAGAFRELKASGDALALSFGLEGMAGAIQLAAKGIREVAQAIEDLKVSMKTGHPEFQAFFESLLLNAEQKEDLKLLRRAQERASLLPLSPDQPLALDTFIGPPSPLREIRTPSEAELLEAQLTKELGSAKKDLLNTETALDALLAKQIINQQQYNLALARTIQEAQTAVPALTALKGAFLAVDTSVGALGASIGNELVGAIDSASGALADFAISGFRDVESLKQALSDLFADLAKQVLALIIKMIILRTIQAAIGGGTAAAVPELTGHALGGGLQAGGPMSRGETRLVGEQGPELFRAPAAGNIIPSGQTAEALAPEVNVSVHNHLDPDVVVSAMGSPEGERVIVNVMRRHKRSLDAI